MTRVILYRDDSNHFCGFSVSGHSGYADEGSDIVCAAVSSCSELLLAQLCDSFGFDTDCRIVPEKALVECKLITNGMSDKSRDTASLIIDGFYRTMSELAKEYSRFLKCTITEV